MSIDVQEFYNQVPIDEKRIIPNQLFQTWKTSIFDDQHAKLLLDFRNHNKEISFHFYDDLKMENYMEERWGTHPIFKVFSNTKVGASKADIWRYCILYDYGGIYLDIDSLILFKLIQIPDYFHELISFESNLLERELNILKFPHFNDMFRKKILVESKLIYPKNIILNWAMMYKKQHPILKFSIDFIAEFSDLFKNSLQANMLNSVLHFTGPLVLTRSVWKYLEKNQSVNQIGIDFDGSAIFKAFTSGVYGLAEHYSNMNNKVLYG